MKSDEWYEKIWDNALRSNPCKCGNDDNWVQIAEDNGPIYCKKCGTQIVPNGDVENE